MLEEAVKSLRAAQLATHASNIVYLRGEKRLEISAVPGKTVFRTFDSSGLYVRTESRDFIVMKESVDFEPERGDRIEFLGSVYEVLAPSGEPVWRWSDVFKSAVRIHTKEIGDSDE